MNTKILIGLILLVLLTGGAYAFISRQNASSEPAQVAQGIPVVNSGGNTQTESIVQNIPAVTRVAVEISNFAFKPKEIRIPVGTKVIWKNEDSVRHTATADNGEFKSPLLGKGETFEFTFRRKGTFSYFCEPHPNMKATVIVE